MFGTLLHDPNLWHLNRHSVAGATAVGLFTAFLPIPFQMVVAAALAIAFRVNLPISVVLVWVTNPLTMGPIYYACYKLGAWILDVPPRHVHFSLSWAWFSGEFLAVWKPLLLGCLLAGLSCALLGSLFVRLAWRAMVVRNWRLRKRRRMA